MSILFFIGNMFRFSIWNIGGWIFPSLKVGSVRIDEDLPNYNEALDPQDRDWIIKEEENCRKVMGFNCLLDDALEKFKEGKSSKKVLQGTPNYDILGNILYMDDFQYFSPAIGDRSKYIIDDDEDESNDTAQSDLVKLVLNLAYMKEEDAIQFKFDKSSFVQQL